ncbi:EAL domain-containing protein [Massilia terrae]|uniref:EAL domain-containing protein n=1 Tax=Massilia terrae TaxID=1811224 RepID=A0ABT2CTM0_9BURK|nr:EAL domain-containing protein [Massilia terrae]MCS0657322.1 EAL domain-containing protein [Massilia terrae]
MSVTNPRTAVENDSDGLVFADEIPRHGARAPEPPWRIMIVDDDADVHTTTTFALSNMEMQGRPLEFVHAYSAAEARELLRHETGLAVILLDVVMEQADAGLHLVRHVRETLGMRDVRIILRTGQPGYAPEMDAIRGYDINDYRSKSELTRTKLYTAVAAAVRSFEQIRALQANRTGLETIARASAELMALHGPRDFGHGVLAQLAILLNQPADGVLCSREPGQHNAPLRVLAGSGSCAHLADGAVTAHPDHGVPAAIERALAERTNLYLPGHLVLYFSGKSGRDFAACLRLARPIGDIERRLLDVFCGVVAVGLDNVELVTHLHRSAFYDSLTGLPNRTRLVELLDATLAGPFRAEAILALVDIDHFSETNDALGHQFGDSLLNAVAERLRASLSGVTVARIGGDVFCVLGAAQTVTPAGISALFDAPFSIDGQDVQVAATLGLVRLSDHDGSGTDALKDADIALKRAKSQHGSKHFYFTRGLGIAIRERVRMMHALRRGFRRGELYLAYQPQVDLDTGHSFGAEALLRWRTEDGEDVAPDRFVPIAEYSGLIAEIGEWVLLQACRELMRLRAAGHTGFTMSVNVSQVQFRHPHFIDMLRRVLQETGAPAENIELEITESMAMEEPDVLAELLAQVKGTGVSIAIDDFGTGFSSLSHLQRLQVDRLKIDRAFVSEITGSARGSSIAEMVIQLGRNLGLSIIAEGVEDERQAHILRALGCRKAQGFLFARPLAPDALLDWLAQPH